jgi:hypothetical protein
MLRAAEDWAKECCPWVTGEWITYSGMRCVVWNVGARLVRAEGEPPVIYWYAFLVDLNGQIHKVSELAMPTEKKPQN